MKNNSNLVLECIELEKSYHDGEQELNILHNLNFQVARGEKIAIVGSSGSGKSTFLQILGGLDKPSKGMVRLDGIDMTNLNENGLAHLRNHKIGFIYQFHHLLPEFTVIENVCMPLLIRGNTFQEAKPEAEALLSAVGLAHRLKHKPSQLSGGERQRAAVARALVGKPLCVLADEPTGNLDPATAELVYNLIIKLNTELQTTFIIVTHDHQLANRMDKVYELHGKHLLLR